jgi:hypothetical protein
MSKQIVVQLDCPRHVNASYRHNGVLIRLNDGEIFNRRDLWFEYTEDLEFRHQTDGNQFLLAVLMDAMREKRDIRIHGRISKTLVRNLHEFQRYWSMMRPGEYSPVEINAEGYFNEERGEPRAVLAFSGGLDSVFTAWNNPAVGRDDSRYDIVMAAMIHGFDIPISAAEAFRRLSVRWTANLEKIGIPLRTIRTNFRDVVDTPWEDVFGTALAAALTPFKAIAGYALIGSSAPYDALIHPYGSSPITDHLLSSGDFGIIHDGASSKRLEKVKVISRWPDAMNHLQVCWEGAIRDQNCGICEKCIRTKTHFAIQGLPIPASLGDAKRIHHEIRTVRINTIGALSGWTQTRDFAAVNRLASWHFSIKVMMLKNRIRIIFKRMRRLVRSLFRRLLSPARTLVKRLDSIP